ncbi:uncharacterized protein BBA_07373 [Beauveria bassiana ARSEF 2860]|uniref:Uncharacterized protein n=1 Tax=Beauveria bassiana (strain ARSEF 2860) TaxID=655819 RepID=J4KMC8_BEAB2|nr:uncharacterized protein BBA_07373 [Beauveria bassiana ARSEF 2860]EJP63729.1 hypothetical protein BBA_07373 [Beauveria bassiana ARSEF 2860]
MKFTAVITIILSVALALPNPEEAAFDLQARIERSKDESTAPRPFGGLINIF